MANFVDGAAVSLMRYGYTVTRDTATIPQTAAATVFTVSGGLVAVVSLTGIVTTAIGATATTLKVTGSPTSGTGVDWASATAITSKEVGSIISLPATFGGGLLVNNAGGGPLPYGTDYVMADGNIRITTSASTTGSIRWVLQYTPLEPGAQVVAA